MPKGDLNVSLAREALRNELKWRGLRAQQQIKGSARARFGTFALIEFVDSANVADQCWRTWTTLSGQRFFGLDELSAAVDSVTTTLRLIRDNVCHALGEAT
jgi:hypothetical protein